MDKKNGKEKGMIKPLFQNKQEKEKYLLVLSSYGYDARVQ